MPEVEQRSVTGRFLWLFFGLSGRISRWPYFLAGLQITVLESYLLYNFVQSPPQSGESQFWALMFVLVLAISVWCLFALAFKRLHDFDKPGALAFCLFIPAISIIAFLIFCLVPGTEGPNGYGHVSNAPDNRR